MSKIVFATGGTTGKSKIVEHDWSMYNFVTEVAAAKFSDLVKAYDIKKIANCFTAGNLWGGFLFAHELCRNAAVHYYPYASAIDCSSLCTEIQNNRIDSLLCLPSFAEKLINESNATELSSLKNILYLGESFSLNSILRIRNILPGIHIKPLAYTSQETGVLGFQCENLEGNDYHVYEHVKIVENENNGELIASLTYSNGISLENHATGDVGNISNSYNCPCGHNGSNVKLTGRLSTHTNILGTSISIYEFVNALRATGNNHIEAGNIQLVTSLIHAKGTSITLLINNKVVIDRKLFKESLLTSPLIKEVISDSSSFVIRVLDKKEFLLSNVSGKIKSFVSVQFESEIPSTGELIIIKEP
jgi:phenylacetate-CoA ligase